MENITSKGTIFGTLIAQAGPKGDTGKTGDRGLTGEAGYSPIKGVDYFTQEDISEIRKGIEGDLTGEYNKNAIEKTNIFNTNAKETTTSFDLNAENKTKEYNDNALAEIEKYNSNAIEKSNNFDTNFENKTSKFDSNYDEKTKEFNDNNDLGIQNYNNNAKKQMEIFDTNFTEKLEAFNNNAGTKFNGFNTNSDKALAEYNKNHTTKMKEFDDNYDTKTKTFDDNAAAKLDEYNKNTKLKEKYFNDNAGTKTETFNTNAADKQNEFDENASDKLAEYNQNAKELINKVEQVQAENEALKAENKLIKEQIPSASASGNSIHVEDSGSLELEWKLRDEHYQKQTIQNDNLLILEDTTITTNGITLVIKDGVITINGNSIASTNIDFKIKKKLKAGTYWHMVQRSGSAPSGNVGFLVMKSGGSIASINGRGGAAFTLNEDTEVFYRIWTDKNNTISNVAYKCSISEGSDSKPWVQGIPDSPSIDYSSEIETVGSNVNELNIADVEEKEINGVKYSVKNGVLRLDGTATEGTDIALIRNVILKKGIYTHSTNYVQAGMFVSFDNENGLNGSNNITKNTFELTEDTTYSRYFVWINKGTVLNNVEQKLKLEKGSEATPWSPYRNG